jgi:uncharacterized protein (TIGR02246 family)
MTRESPINRWTTITLAALLVVVTAACAPCGSQPSTEIPSLSDQWEAALNSGDVEGIASLYTEDCRLLAPGAEMATGRDAVRATFGGMIDAGMAGELETVEAIESGDVGYNLGVYTLRFADGAVADRGKFLEVWKKVDGEWKLANDIFNSDMPAGPAGSLVIATHEVEVAEHWLAAWKGPDSRVEMFKPHGVAGVHVFQSPDDPEQVGLLIDVTDMESFQSFMTSDETQAAKAEDGVIERTLRFMTEVK